MGKSIVVTGGLGFLGSEVCRQLINSTDYQISVIDNNCKQYGRTKIDDLLSSGRIQVYNFDLTVKNTVIQDYLVENADYVIGLASRIGGIGFFNKIPAQIIRDNSLINLNLLDYIVNSKLKPTYLYVSSSMVYESATQFPSKESEVDNIQSPITAYGQSKLLCEWQCKAYEKEYGLKHIIIRPFNAIGQEKPDPNFIGYSHVVPDFVCKIKNGAGSEENPLEILGNGQQVRHYTSSDEIANGLLTCLFSSKSIGQDFNIAVNKGHTVIQIAQLINKVMRPGKSLFVKYVKGFNHDVQFRSPDTTKMKEYFGWEAKKTADNIMPEIVESVLAIIG